MVVGFTLMGPGYDHAKCMVLVQTIQVANNHDLLSFRREVVAVYFSKYSKEKASKPTSSSRISTLSSMSKKPCLMIYASTDLATFRNEAILTKDVQNVEIIQKNGVGNAAKAYMISASMISTDFKTLFYMYLFWIIRATLRNVTSGSFQYFFRSSFINVLSKTYSIFKIKFFEKCLLNNALIWIFLFKYRCS